MQLFALGNLCLNPVICTWLLPLLLRYRRGVSAGIGAVISVSLITLLAFTLKPHHYFYPCLYSLSLVICYLFGLVGLALCVVGIHDRKPSAICGLLALLAMLISGSYGSITFWILVAIGFLIRRFDPPTPADLRDPLPIAANNRTRRSRSIPRKLIREGRIHLVPLFYLLNLSGLGREGIARSGSYEFADHIYRSVPSGITFIGRWIDAILLKMPASVALRQRYQQSQLAIRRALEKADPDNSPLRILAIPCGLPRDLTELASILKQENRQLLSRIEYVGMDVDPVLLEKARAFTADCGVPSPLFHQGNALMRESYPPGAFDVAVSTGLGEFLDDAQLAMFYRNIFDVLHPGGTFYTSISHSDRRSELLLAAFELDAHYRTDRMVEGTFMQSPWKDLTITPDGSGLQSFVVAVK